MPPINHLAGLLRAMQPVLHPGVYAFCVVPEGSDTTRFSPLGTFREAEGVTVIVKEAVAAVRVDHGRADVGVAEQLLHGADVVAVLEQVCGERVPEGVAAW